MQFYFRFLFINFTFIIWNSNDYNKIILSVYTVRNFTHVDTSIFLVKKGRIPILCFVESHNQNNVFIRDTTTTLIRILARAKCQIPTKCSLKAETRHIYSLALLMASRCILYDARTVYGRVFQKFQVAFAKVTSHVGKNSATLKCFAVFLAACSAS